MIRKFAICPLLICLAFAASASFGSSSAAAAATEKCTQDSPGLGTSTFYENGECEDENNVSGKWHRLAVGGNWFTRLFDGSFDKYNGTIAGVTVTFGCEKLVNSGGVAENVTEAGAKKVLGKEMVLEYSKCAMSAPAGCKIGESLKTGALKSVATTAKEVSSVKFEPESGTKIASLTITGCALAGTYPIAGSLTGVVPNTNQSKVEFTTTSGSALTIAGNSATYTGFTRAEVEGTTEVIFIGL
jgi:hypothetical protein